MLRTMIAILHSLSFLIWNQETQIFLLISIRVQDNIKSCSFPLKFLCNSSLPVVPLIPPAISLNQELILLHSDA